MAVEWILPDLLLSDWPIVHRFESLVCVNSHFALDPLPISGMIAVPWDIAYFIDALQPKLGTQNTELVRALVADLNARTAPAASAASGSPPSDLSSLLAALDAFPAWREAKPAPLD